MCLCKGVSVYQGWAEYHFSKQEKYSYKKIKPWLNYDIILGAKIWT